MDSQTIKQYIMKSELKHLKRVIRMALRKQYRKLESLARGASYAMNR